jgi:hypothetical protein
VHHHGVSVAGEPRQFRGVGDGGLGPAAAVTSGSWCGPGRARNDTEAAGFEPGHRAAAGAHGANVDDAHEHWQAFKVCLCGDIGLTVHHQGDVEGGPAHIHADKVAVAGDAGLFDVDGYIRALRTLEAIGLLTGPNSWKRSLTDVADASGFTSL